jgi:C4-dicarboxylate transporter, DctM subunit
VSALATGVALFAGMLVLMALRVPIAMSMFLPGLAAYLALAGPQAVLGHLKGLAYSRLSVYDLSVIPLFLLMGQFATQGGLSRDLFAFANAAIGRVRGGVAMASMLACAAFGSISGSSVATAATVSQVALPHMRHHHYSGRLATATLAAGGTLGILLPPSVVLVVYGILTEQNIAKLFAAAFLPAGIAVVLYLTSIAVYVRLAPGHGPAAEPQSAAQVLRLLRGVWPVIAIFLGVFGGIYGGAFTSTEGASVGVAATFTIALLRGELTPEALGQCFLNAAQTTGMIFLIFLGADMLNSALALTQMPAQLAAWVAGSGLPPLGIVVAILLFYVLLGCVMDELSMILLTMPVVFPVVMGLDIPGLDVTDKAVWFGILVLCVVEIGLIAPPVGLNVYVVNSFARDVPMSETYKGVVPFLIADAVRLSLLIAFPGISLWLVHLLT